jgi:hypothetical protein
MATRNKTTDRARINFDLGDPNVQAQMQARDTYVAPGRVTYGKPVGQGDGLIALGKALGMGLQKYQAYDAQATTKMIEDQTAKADADFQLNRKSFKKAVKDGDIPVGANPHYVRNYQRAELSSLASDFGSQLDVSMTTDKIWERTGSNDISDTFTDYKNEKLQAFLKDNNIQGNFDPLDIANSFAPIIQKEEQRLLGKATELTNKFNEAEGIRVASRSMKSVVDKVAVGDFTDLGLGLEVGVAYSDAEWKRREGITNGTIIPTEGEVMTATISHFQKMLDDPKEGLIANGMSASVANETLATTLLTIARDTGDEDWLDVLRGIKTNNGAYLANSLKISGDLQKTKSYIVQKEQTNIKFKEYLENSPKRKAMFEMKYQSMVNNAIFDKNRIFFDKKKLEKLNKEELADMFSGVWELAILSDPEALNRKGPGSWNDPWLKQELAKIDPNLRKKIISNTLQIRKDMNSHEALKYYTPPQEQVKNYMDIYEQQVDPSSGSQMGAIEKAYRHSHITEAQYGKLREIEINKNMLNHQLYKSPLYEGLEGIIKGAFAGKDPNADYAIAGLGQISMNSLKIKMHMVSYEFLKERAKGLEGGMAAVPAREVIEDTKRWLQGMLEVKPMPGQNIAIGKPNPADTREGITQGVMTHALTGEKHPEAKVVPNPVNPGFEPEDLKLMEETKEDLKERLGVFNNIPNKEMYASLLQKGEKLLKDFKPIPGDPRATTAALTKLQNEIGNLGTEAKVLFNARETVETELERLKDDSILGDDVKAFIVATQQPNADWVTLSKKVVRLQKKKDKILKAKEEQKKLKQMKAEADKKKIKAEADRQKKLKEIARETKMNKALEELENRYKKKK